LPDRGFVVQSAASGSRITGSVAITGSLTITATSGALVLGSSSAYFGEGTYLRNIPRNALTEDALLSTEIKSGSVTASVSPDFGFVVKSPDSGSEFTGSIDVSGSLYVRGDVTSTSGSYFIGDGRYLSNITVDKFSN